MRLFITDLWGESFDRLQLTREGDYLIKADGKYAHCIGCFACMVKTPGQCVFQDELQYFGAVMGHSDEIHIISKCRYGAYSPQVKAILDRSLSDSVPFYEFRNKEVHQKKRYPDHPLYLFKVYAYGRLTQREIETLFSLVERNRINIGAEKAELVILDEERIALPKQKQMEVQRD